MKKPTDKPAVRTALKPIRPTNPITIAPPIVSTVTSKPAPVPAAVPAPTRANRSAPTGPTQIVDIGFYLEIVLRRDRDTFGWIYFAGTPPERRIVIVLNADRAMIKRLLTTADSELIGFFSAWILVERLRSAPLNSAAKEVFNCIRSKLVPEPVFADNDWLAARLSAREWYTKSITQAPIFGSTYSLGSQYLIATLQIPLSPAAIAQPWRLFPPRTKKPQAA